MITKPKRLGTAFATIIYGLTIIIPALAIFFASSGTASAAGESYVFYYDPSNAAAIEQAMTQALGSTFQLTAPLSSALNDTSVYGKGGLLGSTPYAFTYDDSGLGASPSKSTSGALNVIYNSNTPLNCTVTKALPNLPAALQTFKGDPSPQHPYHLTIPLSVTITLSPDDIAGAGPYANHYTVSGTLSADSNDVNVSAPYSIDSDTIYSPNTTLPITNILQYPDDSNSHNAADIIPQSCLPSGLKIDSSGNIDSTGPIQLQNFPLMSASQQKQWPGLQSSTAIANAGFAANNPPTGPTTGNASNSLSCTIEFDNPLTWVICPVVDALTGIVSGVDNLITQQLNIKTSTIFCSSSTCGAYYQAWESFRDIALGLLVVAGLIIVTSEALGMEILDAYTIKKTLPRLLVAAIGITISWPLMNFAVTASDVLGIGVRHLIYYPFTQIKDAPDLSFGGNAANFFFGAGAAAGVGLAAIPAWIAFGGLGALISLAATAALAVIVAIVVLTLRQIVIILLILVSPIAIVAYILPRTQQLYKFWWSNFSRALLMFPMIAAMIATGRVFAAVSFNTPGVIYQFIGFIAYFAPYFMIPLTFKFSGAIMGQLGGMVNNRAQGGFKALRDQRKRMTQERIKAAQTGGLYRSDPTKLGKFANKIGNYTLDIGDSGTQFLGNKRGFGWAFGRKGRILESKIAEEKLQQSQKAEQMANLHYSSGRAISGLHHYALEEFTDGKDENGNLIFKKDENGSDAAAKAGYHKMFGDLQQNFGVRDANGWVTDENGDQVFRKAEGEADVKKISQIYSHGWGQNSRYASAELGGKAALLGSFKGAGNEETQRADLETIGLIAAAKAGRLENDEISGSQTRLLGTPAATGGFAITRENFLRDAATQKRVEQARGHGTVYLRNEDGTMSSTDVYKEPLGEEAQKSFMRISAQELASGKSEAIDSLRDTMTYAASEYEMEMKDGKAVFKLENGQKVKRTDPVALARAKAAQERIRYIASYAVGDTDVGRKVQDIASNLGMGTLGFGGRGATPDMLNPQQPEPPMPDLGP